MIIVNFKTYESATGAKGLALAKIHEAVSKETGVDIIVAAQAVDIYRFSSQISIPVFAQHCDQFGCGAHTGWTCGESLKEAGAQGIILNHSEHRFKDYDLLGKAIARAKELGLTTVVCAEHDNEGAEIAQKFHPDWIAIEPSELIGGDISVSTAKPELIKTSVEKIGNNVLVGAGIKNGDDIKIALRLGAKGVLLASGVAKAPDPEKVLRELATSFKS